MSASFDLQLDMPIIQRIEHLAEDIESSSSLVFLVTLGRYVSYCFFQSTFLSSKNGYLLWKVFHKEFEILFRVAKHDGDVNPARGD